MMIQTVSASPKAEIQTRALHYSNTSPWIWFWVIEVEIIGCPEVEVPTQTYRACVRGPGKGVPFGNTFLQWIQHMTIAGYRA